MFSKTFLAALALLAVVDAAPAPAFAPQPPTSNSANLPPKPAYNPTPSGSLKGTNGNQGAHAVHSNATEAEFSVLDDGVPDGPGSFVTGAGLAWYNPSLTAGTGGVQPVTTYKCFNGPASNFPPISQWMNFMSLFGMNRDVSMVAFDNPTEIDAIYQGIQTVAAESKVDARLITAVIMQESTGNVHVGCTNNGVQNCGLMQAYQGSVSYNSADPYGSVLQMIRDGTEGIASAVSGVQFAPGLVQWIDNVNNGGTSWVGSTGGNPYNALRGYNSGQINFNDLSNPLGATTSYVSDIANRLLGWDGQGNNWESMGCAQ